MKTPLASMQSSASASSPAARLLLAAMLAIGTSSLYAANQTWSSSATNTSWSTTSNWVGSAAPGVITTTNANNTTDIATFNSALSGTIGSSSNPIIIDTNRMIGGLTFDTQNAASYFIGAASGSPTLMVGNNLTTQIKATVTNAQTINAALGVHLPSSTNGAYTIKNDSTTSSATLTLAGGIVNSPNSTRGTAWTLGGTNTGDNTISGVINISNSGGIASTITKSDSGRWIFSNSNTIGGGVIVNAGTLVASNAGALGTVAPIVNSGGTLEIKNVALNNTSTTLNDGGTISGNGASESVKVVSISASAASVTLATVNANDIFTVGVATNGVTGGQASTVARVSGPGTLLLGQSNNYAGGWSIDSGTLRTGNSSALGTAAGVTFGSGSTGKLQLNGGNLTVSALSTNATVGSPIIENGGSGNISLTVNTTATSTYAGTIQNGGAGTLALTKSGIGTLSLAGSNTFSGGTTISGGTLKANNASGSATGSGSVSINTGGTLGGTGTISGAVSLASGGIIAPGNSVGTLTVGSLTAASGSIFNFEFNSTPANDRINVTTSDGLTLNGGGFNLYSEGTLNGWTTTGNYNLIQYAGAIQGTGTGALSVLNPQAGYGYTFGSSSGYVTLQVYIAAVLSNWNVDAGGSWNTAGNWSSAVPNGTGEGAILNKALSSPATITLDGNKTVGGLTLNSANGYTIAAGSGGTLSLNSGVSQASIIVTSGSHTISAPVALASNTVASTDSGTGLTISGQISGNSSLTKSGTGSLDLDSSNTYSGGTTITGGSVGFVAGGLGSGAVSVDNASLTYKGVNTNDLSAQGLSIGSGGAAINIGSNNVTYSAAVTGTGSFSKSGTGTLTMQGNNTFTGSTTINGGGLVLSGSSATTGGTTLNGADTFIELAGDSSLGAVPGVATTNLTLNPGAGNTSSVKFNGATTLAANRSISLASGTGVLNTNGNAVTISGSLGGSGNLVKNGSGVLTLGSAATASGSTTINAGGITVSNVNALPSGAIVLNNDAAITITQNSGQTVNNVTVNGTNSITATNNTSNVVSLGSITGGSGTLTYSTRFVGDLTGSWSGFSGTIALAGDAGYRFFGTATGSPDVTLDLGTRYVSVRSTQSAITLGALVGASGSTLSGSTGGVGNVQNVSYTIGGKNLDTTFAGVIQNGGGTTAITKVGNGTLTLSGGNTFTGDTTISAGTLALGANDVLANTSTIKLNGGTLAAGTFTDTLGTLNLTANSSITLGSGGSLIFADSSSLSSAWGSFTLSIAGSYVDGSSIRFGTSNTGLTSAQLALININGQSAVIDSNGYLSAVPEPSTWAALAGLSGLAFAAGRRRRRAA
ncbi:PEP-CTERM sorting domain-containing protein [bacterium]|nr:PEP-CTERM sorting domain-containing protein [bacterium]